MKHRIMVTSLRKRDIVEEGLQYFCFKDEEKNMYCDALTSAEAASKCILANHKIDAIIVFGSESSYDQGDDMRSLSLQEGNCFYNANVDEMSSFSLYRYRLAEYLDEINAEIQDERDLLDEKQKKEAEKTIRQFFSEKSRTCGLHKFNRFFDNLVRDDDMREELEEILYESAHEIGIDPHDYVRWARSYIYHELKETSKMQLLESNEDVLIKFVSTDDDIDDENTFTDLLINNIENISSLSDYADEEGEIFLCMQNDNARDGFVMMTLMETIGAISNYHTHVVGMVMADAPSSAMAETITNDAGKLGVYDLLSATKAFLRYGKTDLLMDFREKSGLHNSRIDQMIYAMRNIDTGISLCDISDIERGIARLRDIFSENYRFTGNSFAEKYFNIIAQGIRQDYGPLLSGDEIEFIELVKWAYRKEFWQQTLTLIESRAPRDFVDKGIYYYCDCEEDREEVIEKFGKLYYDLKPFEKYKLDDIDHYFIKFYGRWRTPHPKDSKEYQLKYTKVRIDDLDTDDSEVIRAHTICPDKDALRELLFAYYYLGDVRNATNHAADEFSGFISVMDDSDVSARMNLITQVIDYFIHCYDNVTDLISKDKADAEIVRIETSELADYAKVLRKQFHDNHKSK